MTTKAQRDHDFARLTEGAPVNLSQNEEDNYEDSDEVEETLDQLDQRDLHDPADSRARRRVTLPYSSTSWAALEASFPLTGDEWDQMLAVLTAMKPALTMSEPRDTIDPAPGS